MSQRASQLVNSLLIACLTCAGLWLVYDSAKRELSQRQPTPLLETSSQPAKLHVPTSAPNANMPNQTKTVDSYTDGGGGVAGWDTTTPGQASLMDIGSLTGTTNTLNCNFNAGTFSIPGGYSVQTITVSFNIVGTSSGSAATVHTVKLTIAPSNLSDGASVPTTSSTFSYGGTLWGAGSISISTVNGAWTIQLAFDIADPIAGFTTITISNVEAVVAYQLSDIVVHLPPVFPIGNFNDFQNYLYPEKYIFKAGFASTPIPDTPFHPANVVSENPALIIQLAELYAGHVRYAKGFGVSLPVPTTPLFVIGSETDRTNSALSPLLDGNNLFIRKHPLGNVTFPVKTNIHIVSADPILRGLPPELFQPLPILRSGKSVPATPSSQVLPPHIVSYDQGWETILALPSGSVRYLRGFAESLPVPSTRSVVIASQTQDQLSPYFSGEKIAWAGFAPAPSSGLRTPAIIAYDQGSQALASLLEGSAKFFHPVITPAPSPPLAAAVVASADSIELLPQLSPGSVVALKGFRGAQPLSPQPSWIVSPEHAFPSILVDSLAGQAYALRGFARAELPTLPVSRFPVRLSDSDLLQTSTLLAGQSLRLVGPPTPVPNFPARTVQTIAAMEVLPLYPSGSLALSLAIEQALPVIVPAPRVVHESNPLPSLLDRLAGSILVYHAPGFPVVLPAPKLVRTETPSPDQVAGKVLTYPALSSAPISAFAGRPRVVAAQDFNPDDRAGHYRYRFNLDLKPQLVAPYPFLAVSRDETAYLISLQKNEALTNRYLRLDPLPCTC